MITHPAVRKASIRRHYDLLSPFYRLLWGRHIHHGLWDGSQELSPAAAQIRLIEELADAAGIEGGQLLDVGCGLGGSAIHLASSRGCDVTGVTLSGVQRVWAELAARRRGVAARTRFLKADAESVAFDSAGFDVLWSVECTEHLFDKPAFFRNAAVWLRPGGRVALCAWLAGDEPLSPSQRELVESLCEGMLCPSLGSAADYESWLTAAGLAEVVVRDWTPRVAGTWRICADRLRRTRVDRLAPLFGRDAALFVSRFDTMTEAFSTGALCYGAITARKPQ